MIARRKLLTAGLALPILGTLPKRPAQSRDTGHEAAAPRVLVLIELGGGNDGLNSVVPFGDPAYYAARPQLAVPRDQVLHLDENLGLNPALEPLMAGWTAGELAIALGVGYSPPNRSHFRSIEIWNSASEPSETRHAGWIARALGDAGAAGRSFAERHIADGLVLGGGAGPLAGTGLRTISLRDPERFLQQAGAQSRARPDARNPALAHILQVRSNTGDAAAALRAHLTEVSGESDRGRWPGGPLGQQLRLAARLISGGFPVAAIKVSQTGYDTHAQQAGRHRRLLGQLAEGLARFRETMIAAGAWDRVLVMTYAEFGRRVAQNASGGTDHGTAAAHFLLGGGIKGGLYGAQPSLTDLEGGDLRATVDFRRLYATALQDWWSLPATPSTLGGQRPLPFLI